MITSIKKKKDGKELTETKDIRQTINNTGHD